MSDDEQCGAKTRDGHPCKLPADSCPHHEGEDRWPQKLRDREEDILAAARRGTKKENCAAVAGVGKSTLYEWLDRFADFADAFKRARSVGEKELIEDDDTSPEFVLERSYGYTKKQEVEHSGEVSGDFSVNIEHHRRGGSDE